MNSAPDVVGGGGGGYICVECKVSKTRRSLVKTWNFGTN